MAKKMEKITAYCVQTGKHDVPMLKAKINKYGNRYMAQGVDAKGNKISIFMSEADAKAHLKEGNAKKGEGWSK